MKISARNVLKEKIIKVARSAVSTEILLGTSRWRSGGFDHFQRVRNKARFEI
jgi:hypothetical protein